MGRKGGNKIVHVPRRFVRSEWGGTETVILEISQRQKARGLEPVIMTSMALADRREEEIQGVPIRRFSYSYPFLGLSREEKAAMDKKGGNLLSLSLFLALLREPNVRLFHAHALKRLGGETRTAARLRSKPFVVSLHGGVFDVPAAEREAMEQPIRGKFEWGRAFGALFGSRRVLEDADLVICVGQSELEKASRELSHDRLAYLPNGVDTKRFARGEGSAFRKKHGVPEDAFLVLNISRIDAQKNQLLLLRAFAEAVKEEPDLFLILAGPETQPDYAAALRRFLAEQGLESRARILPGLPNDSPDLVNAYHACDAFVLPSIHEPFGIVVLEAWSAGRPVIASKVGGLKSLIAENETGWFIDPTIPEAAGELAKLILRLRREPHARNRLGEAGRLEALGRYDWDRIVDRLEALYQQAERHAAARGGNSKKSSEP